MGVINVCREAGRDFHCLQCDLCFPPRVAFGPPDELRAAGWLTVTFGGECDVCPACRRQGERRPHIRGRDGDTMDQAGGNASGSLPNLLVIGAAKCGTTSLHLYLGLHPEVMMSTPKELNFFQDPHFTERLNTYQSFFDPDAPVRGESTTIYTMYPVLPGVPERISRTVPDAKLIYLVRDPVQRAIASYVEEVTHGMERRPFEDAFSDIDGPYNRYVAASRYATQIERFLDHIPVEQLLVIDQADLRTRRDETMRRVFRFIGVDEGFASERFGSVLNPTSDKRRRSRLGLKLRQTPLARAVRQLPFGAGEFLFRPSRRLLSRPVDVPKLEPRLREELVPALAGEVSRLRELTGQPFETWLTDEGDAGTRVVT